MSPRKRGAEARRQHAHRRPLQVQRHLRPAQGGREREPERGEQLLEPVLGDHHRHPMTVAARFALAQPEPPALALPQRLDELVPSRSTPGLEIGHDRREGLDQQLELVPDRQPGQLLLAGEDDRSRDRQPPEVHLPALGLHDRSRQQPRPRELVSRGRLNSHNQLSLREAVFEHPAPSGFGHRGVRRFACGSLRNGEPTRGEANGAPILAQVSGG